MSISGHRNAVAGEPRHRAVLAHGHAACRHRAEMVAACGMRRPASGLVGADHDRHRRRAEHRARHEQGVKLGVRAGRREHDFDARRERKVAAQLLAHVLAAGVEGDFDLVE
ncbi:hypothetical protein ACVWXM_007132 [Bradyrhizobium sp. GM7.3]